MSTRIRYTVARVLGVLLTGSMLTLTVTATEPTQDSDMQKKHAACEQLKGKQQMDCENRMKDMDKKNKSDSSSVPTSEDKQPPNYAPPR